MPFYRFYQTSSEAGWQVVEDRGHPATLNKVLEVGAIKLSILSVDTAEPGLDKLAAKYRGPFYADIDCASDIVQAAQSTRKLVDKITSLGVPEADIEIFASGKKGFHVIVDARKFSDGKARAKLPLVYKAMAAQLYVVGLDIGVYSTGKGTCWRIENAKRDDTGTYRVRITPEELSNITLESYKELVSAPREFPVVAPNPALAIGLRSMFVAAMEMVESQKAVVATEVPEDLEKIREEVPSCAVMVSQGKTLPEKNFNEVAMQLASYIARVKPSDLEQDSLKERFIESRTTPTHSARARRDALNGLLGYVKSTETFKFSCAGMRSILTFNKCKECPIYRTGVRLDTAKKLGLEVREDGYYTTGDQTRQLSTFTVKATAVLKEYNNDGDKSIRTACLVDLHDGDKVIRDVVWGEDAWKNKGALIGMISGLRNFGFFGSDTDVQKLKTLILEDEENMSEIIRVYSAGMHIKRVNGRPMFTYVEPDYSVNAQGVRDLYKLTGAVPSAVHIGPLPVIKESETALKQRLETGLKLLLQVNDPLVIGQILGWTAGCHLKVHIRNSSSMANAYPLLSLHGSAQSGKNKTAELFGWLNGCRFGTEQSVFNVPGSKAYPLINLLTTTTTIPRILDELNIERIPKSQFNSVVEIMKCSWDCSSIPRGTIGASGVSGPGQTSARLVDQFITAPIIYCSEQEVTSNTALRQRSIPVQLSEKSRHGREQFYADALKYREDFHAFARYMVQTALSTPLEVIPDLISANESLIPDDITDRARHCFLVIFMGLDFFQHNYRELGLDLDTEFNVVRNAVQEFLGVSHKEINKEKNWSNVDTVINTYAIMASFHADNKRQTILPGQDYLYDSALNRLYIRSMVAHHLYKTTCNQQGETALIGTHANFMKIIKEQPYYETDSYMDPTGYVLGGAKCLVLKVDQLREKGIEVGLFETMDLGALV